MKECCSCGTYRDTPGCCSRQYWSCCCHLNTVWRQDLRGAGWYRCGFRWWSGCPFRMSWNTPCDQTPPTPTTRRPLTQKGLQLYLTFDILRPGCALGLWLYRNNYEIGPLDNKIDNINFSSACTNTIFSAITKLIKSRKTSNESWS